MDYEDIFEKPKKDYREFLMQIGEARQILNSVVDDETQECLSKHNEYWDSEDPEVDEKLHALRSRLIWVNQAIYNALEKLQL